MPSRRNMIPPPPRPRIWAPYLRRFLAGRSGALAALPTLPRPDSAALANLTSPAADLKEMEVGNTKPRQQTLGDAEPFSDILTLRHYLSSEGKLVCEGRRQGWDPASEQLKELYEFVAKTVRNGDGETEVVMIVRQ